MSLLSSTRGTPERVWSLVATLIAANNELARAEAAALLNPAFIQDDKVIRDSADSFGQTLGAATSLGAVHSNGTTLTLDPSCDVTDYATFGDWVHRRLISLDSQQKDAVVLEAYAWVAARSAQVGSLAWVSSMTQTAFADEAEKALPAGEDDDGGRRINSTKLPAWRRWLIVMGLLVEMPNRSLPQPSVVGRAYRELQGIGLPHGEELEASTFLQEIAKNLPYLDGGHMFVNASKRMANIPKSNTLSPILSSLLRDLHDQRTIELRVRGDAGNAFSLSSDVTHDVRSFHAVVLKEQPSL
jgi:hypothetical protein